MIADPGPSTSTGEASDAAALRKQGNAHLQQGQLTQAAECYRQAVAADPADAAAHVNLGFVLRELELPADALRHLQQAVQLDPALGDAHYLLGVLATDRNEPEAAIAHLRRALEVEPGLEAGYRDLFSLLFRSGQLAGARDVMERAIAMWPRVAEFRCYLGNVLNTEEDYDGAAACYRAALAIAPDSAGAHNDLGCVLENLGLLDEALGSYGQALQIQPGHFDALVNLGNVHVRRGRLDEARRCYERAIESDGNRSEAHTGLGDVCVRQGDFEEGLRHYREAVRLQPTPFAKHIEAALSGANPEHAPGQYVEGLFDYFAADFDTQLVDVLKYDIPRQLSAAVRDIAKPSPRAWDVLDLGCGTGLAGVVVADVARQLVGVDLSSKMLAKAEARKIYQRLERNDLLVAMQAERDAQYDLVIAADVFVYVGRLDAIVAEAARLLRPGGLLAFSVEDMEHAPAEPQDFRLKRTARYGHSAEYLERLAAEQGFAIRHMRPVQVRIERGKPVDGSLAVWSRDPSLP